MKFSLLSPLKTAYLIAGAVLVLSSCDSKKDDPKPVTPPVTPELTKTELLSAKPWKMVSATIDPPFNSGGNMITDYYSQMPQCQRDDLDIYRATDKNAVNGVFTYDQGTDKCQPQGPQSVDGTWTFNTDKTKVTQVRSGVVREMTIVTLNATTLKVTFPFVGNPSNTITATYEAQ